MKLIDLLTKEERQQLRVRYDDASFRDYVNELLNKDVDTVKHGRWIGKPIAGYATVRCSECGDVLLENDGRFPYCPYCGAKMN